MVPTEVVPSPQSMVALNSPTPGLGLASVKWATTLLLKTCPSMLRMVRPVEDSGASATVVLAVALLLAGLGSVVVVVAEAILASIPSSGADTTIVNVADAPAASVAMVPLKVPVPPGAGVLSVKAGPEVCIAETNVLPVG